jgi:hypothetical protein
MINFWQFLQETGDLNSWGTRDGVAALRPQSVHWKEPSSEPKGLNLKKKRKSKKALDFSKKKQLSEAEDLIVYCDMDGVLADLAGKVSQMMGEPVSDPREMMRALVLLRRKHPKDFENGEFWANLNWTPHGKEVWNAIRPYNPLLLTGAIRGRESNIGKQIWAERELGLPIDRILFSTTKHEYARPNAVLIDDTKQNIDNWEKHGGIGILHSDSNYQNTLQALNAVLSPSNP